MKVPGVRARAARLVLTSILAAAPTLSAPLAEAQQEASPPETRCHIDDSRLEELSGLAADAEHVYAVNDGGTRLEVAVLDDDCQVTDVLTAPTDPYDVEDLALGPDGTLWLGDTGDNRARRETAALHALSRDGTSVLYRLTYPDGPRDAEALVVDGSGTPYIITKAVLGESRIYRPAAALHSPGPTALEEVGTLSLKPSGTPGGPVGALSGRLITGAALSADGRAVAVRTYTDAYLYPVRDGGILAAFDQEPVRIPLPDEPQGEAIAFTPDGALLSASEGRGEPLRAVTGATNLVGTAEAEGANASASNARRASGAPAEGGGDGIGIVPSLGIAVVTAALVATGLSRRRGSRR